MQILNISLSVSALLVQAVIGHDHCLTYHPKLCLYTFQFLLWS